MEAVLRHGIRREVFMCTLSDNALEILKKGKGKPMEPIVGTGKYTYKVNEDWARLPDGVEMRACAVSVDSQDRVYCFNRVKEHPVLVFDRDGNFLSSWGAERFSFPHAIRIDDQDFVWLVDEYHAQFQKFTTDGQLVQTIGVCARGLPVKPLVASKVSRISEASAGSAKLCHERMHPA